MKLQILIPQWHEEEKDIEPLLTSIALQQGINFNELGVIIVNDGSDILLSENFLDRYKKLNIKYFINKNNVGVSMTRNIALDAATADYVMWCDADDMFCDMRALFSIFNQINELNFNIFISSFLQETIDEQNGLYYVQRGSRQKDATFVHGKVFKRQFLIDNDIRWNPKLTIHEDSYFNCLALVMSGGEGVIHCPDAFYIWKCNPNSVSRQSKNYIPETYVQMLDSNEALVDQLFVRNEADQAFQYICGMIYQAYFQLNYNPLWLEEENQAYKSKTINRFKQYFNKYRECFNMIQSETRAQILLQSQITGCEKNLTGLTFETWIEKIYKGE